MISRAATARPRARKRVDVARICSEAASLANRRGLDALSMSELSHALNVRTPSLYSHVAGIGDVKRLLALRGLAELEEGAARATVGRSGPEAVRALLGDYRQFAGKNPGLYAATVPTPPRSDREWSGAVDRLMKTFLAALQGYAWPGNIRELRNVLERALLFAKGDVLDRTTLRFDRSLDPEEKDAPALTLDEAERRHIAGVLRGSGGHVEKAAQVLSLSRSSLYAKLKKYGIKVAES